MPTIKVSVPHSLDPQEAVQRIQSIVRDVKGQFADRVSDIQEEWTANSGRFSFKAMGFAVSGTVDVDDREVRIQSNLPFAATPFKNRIETVLVERARALLSQEKV
jgi:Putative polyhydroxyalkanoic acid system protein (PHA_gran_rgn)